MKTLQLAVRNLMRNRRRSMTTLLAMIIGASAILLFGGFSRSITYGLQTGTVQRSGHLQIQHKDFFLFGNGNPAAYGMPRYQEIIDAVKSDPVLGPMLTVVTPMLQVSGIAGNFAAGASRTVVGSGTVVVEQNRMREWNDYKFPLSWRPMALSGTSEDSVVIGVGVARVLHLCETLKVANCPPPPEKREAVGNATPDDIVALAALDGADVPAAGSARIDMLAASAKGAPNVAGLNVVKAETQGMKEFDDIYIGLHLAQAQKLIYGSEPPQATAIVLQLQHTSQIPAATERVQHLLSTRFKEEMLGVQDFATLNPLYGQSINMFRTLFSFVAVLIGVIVLFTVSNTMSMAVVERTVEIGTLRAMGLRRGGIRRLFVCEGLLLGLIGAALGVTISIALSVAINNGGLTWTPPGYVIATPLSIYVLGENGLIVGCALGLIAVAVLSALWPASRAAKMAVVDALRHV